MRLTVTSVVAASGVIDELGHFGAVQVMCKLAATTVSRDANLPAGIPGETGWARRYRQVSSASIRRFRSFSRRSQEAGALSSVDQHGFPSQDDELIRPA